MPRKKKVVEESKIGSVISIDDLIIRSEPKTVAPICQKITQKSDITIIGESTDWYLVKYKTICGYIPKSFIS